MITREHLSADAAASVEEGSLRAALASDKLSADKFTADHQKLQALWDRVENAEKRSEDVAAALPGAFEKLQGDGKLTPVLAPHLHELLRQALSEHPELLAHAMAPMVARAVVNWRMIMLAGVGMAALCLSMVWVGNYVTTHAPPASAALAVTLPGMPEVVPENLTAQSALPAGADVDPTTKKLVAAYEELSRRTAWVIDDRKAIAGKLIDAKQMIVSLHQDIATRQEHAAKLTNDVITLQNNLAAEKVKSQQLADRNDQLEALAKELAAKEVAAEEAQKRAEAIAAQTPIVPVVNLPALACPRDAAVDFLHLHFTDVTGTANAGITTLKALLPDHALQVTVRLDPNRVFDATASAYLGSDAPAATRTENINLLAGLIKALVPTLTDADKALAKGLEASGKQLGTEVIVPADARVSVTSNKDGTVMVAVAAK